MMRRTLSRPIARCLVLFLTFAWGVLPVAAQDSGDAATQRFMEERLASLRQQQQRLAAEFEGARQGDPQRAEYLGRLMQENQVLEQRYTARLRGAPDPAAPPPAAPQNPADTASQGAPRGPEEGGVGGMLKGLMGGGEMNTTDLIISVVSGLGGWYLGKMAFGPIGGIIGGIVAPMLAKFITQKIREMRNGGSSPGGNGPDGYPGPGPAQMPGVGESAHGAPSPFDPQKAAVQSADIAKAKAQMDAAYVALTDAIQRGLPPAEIAQRRNVYAQWQVVYNDSLARH